MKKVMINRLCVIISGGITPFAFAPYGFYFLPVLTLTILFYCWKKTASAREALILGYLFGFALFGIGVNWLHISINLFGGVNFIGALFFTYLLVAFISLYPALCGYLLTRFFKAYAFIALAPLWLLTEWCRGWFLTGFPWLNIGTSQTDSPLASFVPLIGDYGVTFIVCLLASSILFLISGTLKERIINGAILATIIISCAFINKTDWTQETGETISVALIQGAIPQKIKWKPEQRQKTYELYSSLSERYWSSDLIIWPETAIPALYHLANDFIGPISNRKENENALFMSGLAYKDQTSNEFFNSVVLIDKEHYFYHKHHLVPFGEYLPLKPLLGVILGFLKIPMSDFSAGAAKEKILKTDKAVFGMSICYEDAYSSEIRRSLPDANILVNVSNDAWFGDSLAPHQHLQIARMRALESGRYLLRSTNTGISAVIDNKGKVISRSPQFKPHALYDEVKLFEGATPYSRYGNSLMIMICLLILLVTYGIQRRKNNASPLK